jgi:Aerotolerance regulator N-terminal
MSYLQPWMLWALPAVLLPLLIHLLNRLRYKTVHWAAMLFLLQADRSATRRAKIRQYLLLACRMVVILFLIWAMARPLVGGWLGSAAGGAPEAVVILLDRSASMEAHARGRPESKREHALALLAQAARQNQGSRFALIENVLREPLELASATSLPSLQMAGPTDTAADLPAMFRAALDYLAKNNPGGAELWVASDLQASNWRPESAEWQDIAARFAGLRQSVRVRVLDLSTPPGNNISVLFKTADLRVRDAQSGAARLTLGLEFRSIGEHPTVPVLVTREGTKSQIDLKLDAAVQRETLKFDLPKLAPGWGEVELPADDQISDNSAYYVVSPPTTQRAAIVGDGPTALRLRFAAAPDKTRADRVASVFSPGGADGIDWKNTALLIWAAPAPSAEMEKRLEGWIENGGWLLAFPPGGEAGADPVGLRWSAAENAAHDAPFHVAVWDDLDGPLARTESGAPLPLARVEIARRQLPSAGDKDHVFASFADGRPFLVGGKRGAGRVFACATQPDKEWSSLGDGVVLLPMVQRLLALGAQRFSPPAMAIAGEWKPSDPQEIWTPMDPALRRDWRCQAGIYHSGDQMIALNRPEIEDLPEVVERARLPDLLHGVKLTVMAGAMELKADSLQSEIWPAMIIVTMAFLCAEMLLATSRALLPKRPSFSARPQGTSTPPAPAASRS